MTQPTTHEGDAKPQYRREVHAGGSWESASGPSSNLCLHNGILSKFNQLAQCIVIICGNGCRAIGIRLDKRCCAIAEHCVAQKLLI